MTQTLPELEPLMSVPDVCRLFGISRRTLERIIREGQIVSYRVGRGRRMFAASDLRAYLEQVREGGS